jgi:hypothetical protein
MPFPCLAVVSDNIYNLGTFICSLQVIYSMADEYVPEYVDKKALAER